MNQMFRKELKYPISLLDFNRLRKRLECYVKPDPYSGYSGYRVRSLYFDADDDRDFFDTLYGNMEKRKIRLRYYPPDQKMFRLEYKCKSGLDGIKRSIVMSKDDARSLVRGDYSILLSMKNQLALELYGRLVTGVYHPRSIVDYHRIAYSYPVNDTRLNFDSKVSASFVTDSFFDEKPGLIPLMHPDLGVFEVKYDYLLVGVLKEILSMIDAMTSANSKYGQSRFLF